MHWTKHVPAIGAFWRNIAEQVGGQAGRHVVHWGCLCSCLAGCLPACLLACQVNLCVTRCRQAIENRCPTLCALLPNPGCRHVAAGAGRGFGSCAGPAAQHGPRRRCALPARGFCMLLGCCPAGSSDCNRCLAGQPSFQQAVHIPGPPPFPARPPHSPACPPPALALLADVWANPVSYDKLGVRYRRWRNSGGCALQCLGGGCLPAARRLSACCCLAACRPVG